jgi:hypothetical protein
LPIAINWQIFYPLSVLAKKNRKKQKKNVGTDEVRSTNGSDGVRNQQQKFKAENSTKIFFRWNFVDKKKEERVAQNQFLIENY